MRLNREKNNLKEILINKEVKINGKTKNRDTAIILEKGDRVKISDNNMQRTFGFGNEHAEVESDNLFFIDDKEKMEFEKIFSTAYIKEIGDPPSSGVLETAIKLYRQKDERNRDIRKDSIEIIGIIISYLDSIVEEINKDTEVMIDYYHSDDFGEDTTFLISDSDFRDVEMSDDLLEKGREYNLSKNEISEFAFDNATINIDYTPGIDIEHSPDNGELVYYFLPLGEKEVQLSQDLLKKIEDLSYEEFSYVIENIDYYMSKENRDLVYFNDSGHFEYWSDEKEIMDDLDKEYGNKRGY